MNRIDRCFRRNRNRDRLAALHSLAGLLAMTAPLLHGADFVVTSSANDGAGSLRQAILDANASPGPHLIRFNLPGAGVQTIAPASNLPALTQAITLDGYSQPGAVANTRTVTQGGLNGSLRVELSGQSCTGYCVGLLATAPVSAPVTVRGLVLNRWTVAIDGDSQQGPLHVHGNYIGTSADGLQARPNQSGITLRHTTLPGIQLGGDQPAQRNLLSGNSQRVLFINCSAAVSGEPCQNGARIRGNLIGVAADGSTPLGNGGTGTMRWPAMMVQNAYTGSRIEVGGDDLDSANVIAHSNGPGIVYSGGWLVMPVRYNLLHGNRGPAFDLDFDGPTANDPGDADNGPNLLMNTPQILAFSVQAGQLTIRYRIDTTAANANYPLRARFYLDRGGPARLLAEDVYGIGSAQAQREFSVPLDAGVFVTGLLANTTDADGNSSEFGGDVIFRHGQEAP